MSSPPVPLSAPGEKKKQAYYSCSRISQKNFSSQIFLTILYFKFLFNFCYLVPKMFIGVNQVINGFACM